MNPNTILIVADISGYTSFMKRQVISISHAKQIIVRLLRAMIKECKPPLRVAEIEGDAVFFYATFKGNNSEKVIENVKGQIMNLFKSFYKELQILANINSCSCSACQAAGDLKLKQVIHTGEVEFEKINKVEKLFGLDVIVVHRMLKNSVPAKEYVMMTERANAEFKGFHGLRGTKFKENFEGIGETDTMVFYPEIKIDSKDLKGKNDFSLTDRGLWKLKLTINTFLDFISLKKFKGSFKNFNIAKQEPAESEA